MGVLTDNSALLLGFFGFLAGTVVWVLAVFKE